MQPRPSQREKVSNSNVLSADRISEVPAQIKEVRNAPKTMQVPKPKDRKRIFLSGVNSLVGHALFEQMRNDHLTLRNGKKSNEFSGTMIRKDADTVPSPNEQIKIVDSQRKPKTFGKAIISADCVVIDLMSGTDLDEAEKIIQILR